MPGPFFHWAYGVEFQGACGGSTARSAGGGAGGGGHTGATRAGGPSVTSTSSTHSVCLASVASPKKTTLTKPFSFDWFQLKFFTSWSSYAQRIPLSGSKSKVHLCQPGARRIPRYVTSCQGFCFFGLMVAAA